MLTLAIDTSQRVATVAVIHEKRVIASLDSAHFDLFGGPSAPPTGGEIDYPRTAPGSSALTLPLIKSTLEAAEIRIQDIDLIGLSKGPGLFTGLRVGVVAAKVFAFSLGKPVVAVNSLEVCASDLMQRCKPQNGSVIHSICNAQRKQLFAAKFTSEDGKIVDTGEHSLATREAWLASIGPTDFLTGPGLDVMRARLASHPIENIADESECGSNAASVGLLAIEKFHAGQTDDPYTLEPIYFRPSAAEEVRNAKVAAAE